MTTDLIPTADAFDPDYASEAQRRHASELAESLRTLAWFVEGHPQLAESLRYPLGGMHAPVSNHDNARDLIAAFARAAAISGATVNKNFDANWGGINVAFGPVGIYVYTHRADVCERVVVGTEEVTKEVPDPDAPKVTVTETVEKVEWRCAPLLAAAIESGSDGAS